MPSSLTPAATPAGELDLARRTPYPADVLDREGVRAAGKELARGLEEAHRPTLFLDLSGVVMPTAAGLGELVVLSRRLESLGGNLVLCNVNDRTHEALAVVGLTGVLDVRQSGEK